MKKKIKILLVDDHLVVRTGLASILSFEKDMEVAGQSESAAKALKLTDQLDPEVVVMDLMLPDMNGAEATRLIRAAHPQVSILILTSFGTAVEAKQALDNGATGALVKTSDRETLCEAIRRTADGKRMLSPEIENTLKCAADDNALSSEQRNILRLVANGYSNKEIAGALGIGTNCVKYHLRIIFANIGAATRAEAASIALKRNLI